MKCPYCGAETKGPNCEYCGSEIPEITNVVTSVGVSRDGKKTPCQKCGSTNISFKREKQGEVREKNTNRVYYRTVGYCKDCGFTWFADPNDAVPRKRKTWLWVLGWIFIFPVPVTILVLRKKNMNMFLKVILIAVAWMIYLAIGYANDTSESTANSVPVSSPASSSSVIATPAAISRIIADPDFILSWNEAGEYGKRITLDEGTELENTFYAFYLPEGTYSVENHSTDIITQITEYSGIKYSESDWDEYVAEDCESPLVLAPGEGVLRFSVKDGQFLKLSDNGRNIAFKRVEE